MAKKKKSKVKKRKSSSKKLELEILVNEANKRLSRLNTNSRAYEDAKKSLPAHRKGGELFTTNLRGADSFAREYTRVNKFLNDWTSFAEGAEQFNTDVSRLQGAWGGQYKGTNYDTTRLNKDLAEASFKIFDEIVESKGGWDRVIGFFQKESKIEFGSDVLLNAIYDMLENGYPEDEIHTRAWALVDSAIAEFDKMAVLQRSNRNYGELIPDKSRRADYYRWRRYNEKGKTESWSSYRDRAKERRRKRNENRR